MATKKQRRRREKLQRHEWEYVLETEEGEEVIERPDRAKKEERKADREPTNRRGRAVPQPSLQRVLKRTAIFGPLVVIMVFILSPDLSTGAKIFQALVLLAFFIPFSYLVDVLVYRTFKRRQARQGRG